MHLLYCISGSYACGVPDPDNEKQLIITGGRLTLNTVSVYSEAGWQRDLTPLNQGRWQHACGSYTNGGKRVKIHNVLCYIIYPMASFTWSLGDGLALLFSTAQRSSVTMSGELWLENYLFQCST